MEASNFESATYKASGVNTTVRTKNYAVIFDRVSSRDQRDGFSLDAQRTLSEKYAAENELKVVRHWSVDESASKEDDRKHFFEMIEYIKKHHVPYNVLHDKGFTSIGCSPCTRAIEPGEDARAGRWWWETSKKECGLHNSNP